MDTTKVNRLEFIDHSHCEQCEGEGQILDQFQKSMPCPTCGGRGSMGQQTIFWDAHKSVELSLQDDGRTLKIFVDERSAS